MLGAMRPSQLIRRTRFLYLLSSGAVWSPWKGVMEVSREFPSVRMAAVVSCVDGICLRKLLKEDDFVVSVLSGASFEEILSSYVRTVRISLKDTLSRSKEVLGFVLSTGFLLSIAVIANMIFRRADSLALVSLLLPLLLVSSTFRFSDEMIEGANPGFVDELAFAVERRRGLAKLLASLHPNLVVGIETLQDVLSREKGLWAKVLMSNVSRRDMSLLLRRVADLERCNAETNEEWRRIIGKERREAYLLSLLFGGILAGTSFLGCWISLGVIGFLTSFSLGIIVRRGALCSLLFLLSFSSSSTLASMLH